jgi:hypothetical protein
MHRYMDSGHGQSFNVPEVSLTNAFGQVLNAAEADIGAAVSWLTRACVTEH